MKYLIYIALLTLTSSMAYGQYNYLGTFDSQGTPEYFDGQDQVSTELINDIAASLPESQPVPTYNPQLISSGYDTNIVVKDSADVWVTFVDEGAGYKNVLGFYSYDINTPYVTKPAASDITIIFPNVSKTGSGGGLNTGDRVRIGTFSANTGIGWVLFADGWKNGEVTTGNWDVYSNPEFNPESDSAERFHNVLLFDEVNEVIVLGFEDIRRDYASCDQDFNDALFYISANPIEAIETTNYAPIVDSESVSSGNDGGLESNGNLAEVIAKRNHLRVRNQKTHNTKLSQVSIRKYLSGAKTNNLHEYFPSTGFTGKEEVHVSSPTDLVGMTNASQVFASDYYVDRNRVGAALLTKTSNSVYNHSKNICDRLNGGSIEDARAVKIGDIEVMYAEIQREQGITEYTSWFSIKEGGANYDLYSYWNIGDYPAGDYLNFQIWGSNPSQVFYIMDHIFQTLSTEKEIACTNDSAEKCPVVIVKNGTYHNGMLDLKIINNNRAEHLDVKANIRRTEFSELEEFITSIVLTGEREQTISIETGQMFDAGISITHANAESYDALYLADGAWGLDYNDNYSQINNFEIENSSFENSMDVSTIERNFKLDASSSDVINIFRNLKAGNATMNVVDFSALSFELANDVPLEVVLVENNLNNWENRLRANIATTGSTRDIVLPFSSFKRKNGSKSIEIGDLQSVVFSYVNNSGNTESISISVANLRFDNNQVLAAEKNPLAQEHFTVYPNPAKDHVNIEIPTLSGQGAVQITDLSGQIMMQNEVTISNGTIEIKNLSLPKGVYIVIAEAFEYRQSKLLKIL